MEKDVNFYNGTEAGKAIASFHIWLQINNKEIKYDVNEYFKNLTNFRDIGYCHGLNRGFWDTLKDLKEKRAIRKKELEAVKEKKEVDKENNKGLEK